MTKRRQSFDPNASQQSKKDVLHYSPESSPITGRIAEYRQALLPEHRGNPLIEALPQIGSGMDLLQAIHRPPDFEERERRLSAAYRRMAVERLRDYIMPLADHVPVVDRIMQMVVAGYDKRNPCDPTFRKAINESYHLLPGQIPKPLGGSSAPSAPAAALLGLSGLGKTMLVERTLSFLPQVLVHPQHNLHQIVYLKLECPPDGSAKSLMLRFIDTVDRLLGTDYGASCRRITLGPLVQLVGNVAMEHHIGLLVLDEAQSLLKASRGDETLIVRFFVNLANTLRVPILTLGTLHAHRVLSTTMHLARRAGDTFTWEPIEFDDEEESTWQIFMRQLFGYQWTKRPQKLTLDLSRAFHLETQGVTALVVRLHQLCQLQIIQDGEEGEVTVDLIRSIAAARFSLLRPLLNALKAGRKSSDVPDMGDAFKELDEAIGKAAQTNDPASDVRKDLRNMGFNEKEADSMVDAAMAAKHDGSKKAILKAALRGVDKAMVKTKRSLMDVTDAGNDDKGFIGALRGAGAKSAP